MSSLLALTWMDQRRTQELCAALGVELAVLKTPQRGALRYLVLSARTVALLVRRRVDVVLVQNPSLVLAVLCVLLRPLLGFRLVVDAHNEAVTPYINRQRWVKWLSAWVIRRSDLTIVSNRQLAHLVDAIGGSSLSLPDPIPVPPAPGAACVLPPAFNVVLIATHARDEPIAEVFEAVRGLDLQLHVTGNPRHLDPRVAAAVPANVRLTGFLPDQDYWGLLRSADGIIDLTLMDHCLVSGAYEALALGKAMLLSDNAACRELFGDAACYTNNATADIRRAILELRSRHEQLELAAQGKRAELARRWETTARDLMAWVAGAPAEARRGG